VTKPTSIKVFLDDRSCDWDERSIGDLYNTLIEELDACYPYVRQKRGEVSSIARSIGVPTQRVRAWLDALDMWGEIEKRRR